MHTIEKGQGSGNNILRNAGTFGTSGANDGESVGMDWLETQSDRPCLNSEGVHPVIFLNTLVK